VPSFASRFAGPSYLVRTRNPQLRPIHDISQFAQGWQGLQANLDLVQPTVLPQWLATPCPRLRANPPRGGERLDPRHLAVNERAEEELLQFGWPGTFPLTARSADLGHALRDKAPARLIRRIHARLRKR